MAKAYLLLGANTSIQKIKIKYIYIYIYSFASTHKSHASIAALSRSRNAYGTNWRFTSKCSPFLIYFSGRDASFLLPLLDGITYQYKGLRLKPNPQQNKDITPRQAYLWAIIGSTKLPNTFFAMTSQAV